MTAQAPLSAFDSAQDLGLHGQIKGPFSSAFAFSACVNLLQLTAPLYMIQVYDRVLGSGSEPTLFALSLLMVFLFLCMGLLDHIRARILARIGLSWQDNLQDRILRAALDQIALHPKDAKGHRAQSDLELLAKLWSSPALPAALDMPFAPLFVLALFLFHPLLGWFALCAMAALILLALAHHHLGRRAAQRADAAQISALRCAEELRAQADVIRALGMTSAAITQWQHLNAPAQKLALHQADRSGGYSTTSKTLRLFLQSAVLGLGAWLVLQDQLAASAMIAGSILLGRALAPIEIAISQWGLLAQSRIAKDRLTALLSDHPPAQAKVSLPRPAPELEVDDLTFEDEGKTLLRGISFRLHAGQVLGIVGPNGAGKTSLLRALTGRYPLTSGTIRLENSEITQFDPESLGRYIGYLPQKISLFGTNIAENIARLLYRPEAAAVIKAAQAANAHEMILRLSEGYDSKGAQLSGGQMQRIALARALYNEPSLLLLDEPDANLDHEGAQALTAAIRAAKARGALVLLTAHRPALLAECDQILMLHGGKMMAFLPRDELLHRPFQEGAA